MSRNIRFATGTCISGLSDGRTTEGPFTLLIKTGLDPLYKINQVRVQSPTEAKCNTFPSSVRKDTSAYDSQMKI